MKYGRREKEGQLTDAEFFANLSIESGVILKPIQERPELWPWLAWIYRGFWELNCSRTLGFGIGPIPLSEMLRWLEWKGVRDYDEQERAVYLLHRMDNEFLLIVKEERDTGSK